MSERTCECCSDPNVDAVQCSWCGGMRQMEASAPRRALWLMAIGAECSRVLLGKPNAFADAAYRHIVSKALVALWQMGDEQARALWWERPAS